MTKLIETPEALNQRRRYGVMDDFLAFTDGDLWTVAASDAGTAVATDAAGGMLELAPSDETAGDNDEIYVRSTQAPFNLAAGRPLVLEARLQFSDVVGDAANVLVGLLDAVTADALQDDGGGPPDQYTGAVLFKVDGETQWRCETSVAGTQTDVKTDRTAGGADFQTLRIELQPVTATLCEAKFFVNDLLVAKHSGVAVAPSVPWYAVVGIKAGNATPQLLKVDYFAVYQLR